jgi:stage II sporulation protein D
MAAAGRDEAAILRFYFPGTTTGIESPSQTWLTHESANWTLIATDPNEALIHAGNAALQRAQTLFPPTQPIHPTVRLFPTTNLYRNTTSEPGWTLAATRNDDIFLQPPPLITHTQSDLLLHEFLHVLIEHETTAPIPLWLHEGLVEALANPTPTHPQMTAPEIEDLLAHPRSLAESQHAHREAGLLVERLIAANSLPAIRTWLHSAVPAQALTQAGLR